MSLCIPCVSVCVCIYIYTYILNKKMHHSIIACHNLYNTYTYSIYHHSPGPGCAGPADPMVFHIPQRPHSTFLAWSAGAFSRFHGRFHARFHRNSIGDSCRMGDHQPTSYDSWIPTHIIIYNIIIYIINIDIISILYIMWYWLKQRELEPIFAKLMINHRILELPRTLQRSIYLGFRPELPPIIAGRSNKNEEIRLEHVGTTIRSSNCFST
jgi:hypothetical protein